MKQSVDGLHLHTLDEANTVVIERDSTNSVITYKIEDKANNKEYLIIHANGVNVSSRSAIDLTGYTLYLDTLGNYSEGELGSVTPQAFETIIAYRNK